MNSAVSSPLQPSAASMGYRRHLDSQFAANAEPMVAAGSKGPKAPKGLSLGILGLDDDSCALLPGGLYALKARNPAARYPVLVGMVANAIRAGISCNLVCGLQPEEFLARFEAVGNLAPKPLIAEGSLRLFSMQPEFGKKMFRYGAERFCQELESFQVPADSFLLFDQADDLLSLHDLWLATGQIQTLRRWFAERRITALLCFNRPSDRISDNFTGIMDYFSGVARLGGESEGLEWNFTYWRSTTSVVAARAFRLELSETGLYCASPLKLQTSPQTSPVPSPVPLPTSDDRIKVSAEPKQIEAASISPVEVRPSTELSAHTNERRAAIFLYADHQIEAGAASLNLKPVLYKDLPEALLALQGQPQATVVLDTWLGADQSEFCLAIKLVARSLSQGSLLWVRVRGNSQPSLDEQTFIKRWTPQWLESGAHAVLPSSVQPHEWAALAQASILTKATSKTPVVNRSVEPQVQRVIAKARRSSIGVTS